MNKPGVDSEAELPIFKKMDFGDDKLLLTDVATAIDDFAATLRPSRYLCAQPECLEKVYVNHTFCRAHSRQCHDCKRELRAIPALRYATTFNDVHSTFWRSSLLPAVYCSDCIQKHEQLPEMPCGPHCFPLTHFKHPLVVVECEIGAAGHLPCKVQSVCAHLTCDFCSRSFVRCARSDHGIVCIIGGSKFCRDCARVNYCDHDGCERKNRPTLDIGYGVVLCSAHLMEHDDIGCDTDHFTGACRVCKKWVNLRKTIDGELESDGSWVHSACKSQ